MSRRGGFFSGGMEKYSKNKAEIIYGEHAALSVLRNRSREIFEINISHEKFVKLPIDVKKDYGAIIRVVEPVQLDKIARETDKHQGFVLKTGALKSGISLSNLISDRAERGNIRGMFLDRIQDPQNIGAIIRSAYCFGMDFIALSSKECPPINATIARASVGYSEVLPIYSENLSSLARSLKKENFAILGLDGGSGGMSPRSAMEYSGNIVFVLGSEHDGIRHLLKEQCDGFIRINMVDGAESLNVSNAAAVVAYESFMQIRSLGA